MILGFKKTFPWGEPTNFREKILAGSKIHTIRAGNRWKAGDTIHMAYGVRTKNYEQFNKDVPALQKVVSVQKIEILKGNILVSILIDGAPIDIKRHPILAINDGFLSLRDFDRWFSKEFSGQIIHWTDFKYK